MNATSECRHLLFDTGLKVSEEINHEIMLVYNITLFIGEEPDSFAESSCKSDHVCLV